jgi:hypothetical protein
MMKSVEKDNGDRQEQADLQERVNHREEAFHQNNRGKTERREGAGHRSS